MKTTHRMWTLIAGLAASACPALADTPLQTISFDDGNGGWLVNGQDMLFSDGNPGQCGGVPYLDFWGITVRNETPGTALVGDVSRHAGEIRVAVDFNVLQLNNFFGDPMPTSWFPLTLELVDYTDNGPVSVYTTSANFAPTGQWGTAQFVIPTPTSPTLPAGWGGTGDEDPVTFEPRLPASRTYASVLANVDEARVTTMQPGYFYASSFWEVRVDNVTITLLGGGGNTCDSVDFNGDGLFPDTLDIDDFVSVFGGGACSTGTCADIDFNNDGLFPDTLDIDALISVFSGGPCL